MHAINRPDLPRAVTVTLAAASPAVLPSLALARGAADLAPPAWATTQR